MPAPDKNGTPALPKRGGPKGIMLAQPQGENTGRPESTTTILGGGPQTRQTAFGTDRIAGLQPGELQSVIGALINLPARYEDEATVIAAVPEEEAS
jgi:hypothetical protein